MKAFDSNKPLYLLLCCINVTLLLLILLATSHPPSRSLQQAGNSIALHDSMEAAGEVLSKQGDDQHKQAMILLPSSFNIRKMASSLVMDVVSHQYHLHQQVQLSHGSHDIIAGAAAPQLLDRLPKFIMAARRSLLQTAEGGGHQQELSTTSVALNKAASGAGAAKTSAHVLAHAHLPHHDVSATFHVDYNGPNTHPPKNN